MIKIVSKYQVGNLVYYNMPGKISLLVEIKKISVNDGQEIFQLQSPGGSEIFFTDSKGISGAALFWEYLGFEKMAENIFSNGLIDLIDISKTDYETIEVEPDLWESRKERYESRISEHADILSKVASGEEKITLSGIDGSTDPEQDGEAWLDFDVPVRFLQQGFEVRRSGETEMLLTMEVDDFYKIPLALVNLHELQNFYAIVLPGHVLDVQPYVNKIQEWESIRRQL